MSWVALIGLAATAYAFKAAGPVLLGGRAVGGRQAAVLALLAVPLLAALTVVQTLDGGRHLVIDARVPSVALAALLAWRRAPFIVILLAAAVCAALLRATGAMH